eukprot:6571423-Alexandrium_andersonii.AAC.1
MLHKWANMTLRSGTKRWAQGKSLRSASLSTSLPAGLASGVASLSSSGSFVDEPVKRSWESWQASHRGE